MSDIKPQYRPKSWYKQLINIAKGQLQIEESTYREILVAKTKKNSLTEMSVPELFTVLEHMKSLGFKPVSNKKKSTQSKLTGPHAKLFSLWQEMADDGHIKNRSHSSLEKWATANCKGTNNGVPVTKLEWFTPGMFYMAIEQVKKWHAREDKKLKTLK